MENNTSKAFSFYFLSAPWSFSSAKYACIYRRFLLTKLTLNPPKRQAIVSCFIPDAVAMLVKQIFPSLLVAPSAVFIKRTNRTHHVKVGVGNAAVLLVGRVNGKVHHHATAHKLLQ